MTPRPRNTGCGPSESVTPSIHVMRCSINKLSLPSCLCAAAKLLQECLTLCDPVDGRPPGSPIPGILQARILEWVAIAISNA